MPRKPLPEFVVCQECGNKFRPTTSYFKGLIYCDSCMRKLIVKAGKASAENRVREEDYSDLPDLASTANNEPEAWEPTEEIIYRAP